MEINQVGAGSLQGTAVKQSASQLATVARGRRRELAASETQATARGEQNPRRRTLSILSQEIRQVLAVSYRINIGSRLPAYSAISEPKSAAEVADDALSAGRALAERSPLDASRSLVDLREKVEDAAADVRELIGDDDNDDLDEAMGMIGDGLDELDEDAARNVESSASFLSYESQLKQRSTIRIRTQEGDIVRLDLRRMEQTVASDIAVTDGDQSFSSTEVALSSRTRLLLSVNGDLNEAEFVAIQNVFAQAEAAADEFFGGDIAKAFDAAAGIEFDTEQLARVRVRFREQLETSFSFAVLPAVTPQAKAVPEAEPAPVIGAPAEPLQAVEPAPAAAPELKQAQGDVVIPAEADADAPQAPAAGAIDNFFQLLADFLRSVNEGFEPDAGSHRYFYSQSFKLEILKSVLEFSAPEGSGAAAGTATTLIDSVAAAGEDS